MAEFIDCADELFHSHASACKKETYGFVLLYRYTDGITIVHVHLFSSLCLAVLCIVGSFVSVARGQNPKTGKKWAIITQ